ncbi:MAG TPA: M20/M25/M40 family metallo-hydrolase [Thermoanaerobaculia bacterium]|nr:M20/M25/M40 family metallo-hydrolase [Thermoanaerobaculia bacterium]
MKRRFLPAVLLATMMAVVPGLSCRRGEAVERDPVETEAEELLVRYLRIDTSNPPGNETRGARFFKEIFDREGIPSRLLGDDPNRQSIYVRLESKSDAPALLLLHHLDVVPADPSEWTVPPFEGRRANGYIWGRGALDIKSLGIAHLMSLLELHRARVPLARDVVFVAVADEEAGGLRGAKPLLDAHPELFGDIGFVLNEGGATETVVDRVTWWGIEIDQKVPLWLRVVARGHSGHGSLPPGDGGAPIALVRALAAIGEMTFPRQLTPSVEAHLRSVGEAKRPLDGRRPILLDPAAYIDTPEIDTLPAGARALLQNTLVVSVLRAGSSVNVIPPTATAELDLRLVPGSDPAPVLASVRAAAGSAVDVDVILAGAPVAPSPADTPLFRMLAALAVESSPGSKAGPYVSAGSTDSRFFREKGKVAYGFNPFPVNYYDGATVHGADERIRARFFSRGVRLMRRIVRQAATAAQL